MFRAFRQFNTAHTAVGAAGTLWSFDATRNTFNATQSMVAQIVNIAGVATGAGTVELVSALEDHIPGFSANWTSSSNSTTGAFNGNYPMDRDADDKTYSGVIGSFFLPIIIGMELE